MKQNHSFHMVAMSPWPIFMALMSFNLFLTMTFFFLKKTNLMNLFFLIFIMIFWWRDVNRESSFTGLHSSFSMFNFRYGMIFFIISEILFFMSFFWSFFHSSLSPNVELGNVWPPVSIEGISPLDLPLLNTIILLSSGVTISMSHHLLLKNKKFLSNLYLKITIMMGIYFSITQTFEYFSVNFMMSDSSFSSCFFTATGFHGFHVLVGTIFLLTSLIRFNFFSNYHHIGFETSIWYWHFVDVVWLFLFCFMYWWSY